MKNLRNKTLPGRVALILSMVLALLPVSPAGWAEGLHPQAREVVFLIDASGSTASSSLPGIKDALYQGLDELRDDDRFNLVYLNAGRQGLFEQSMPVDDSSLVEAMDFIDGLGSFQDGHVPGHIPGPGVEANAPELSRIGRSEQLLLSLATLIFATCLLWFCTPSRQSRTGGSMPPARTT
jgi:hypothetical protein